MENNTKQLKELTKLIEEIINQKDCYACKNVSKNPFAPGGSNGACLSETCQGYKIGAPFAETVARRVLAFLGMEGDTKKEELAKLIEEIINLQDCYTCKNVSRNPFAPGGSNGACLSETCQGYKIGAPFAETVARRVLTFLGREC